MSQEQSEHESNVITAAKRVEPQRVLNYSPGVTSRNDAAYLSFCFGMSAWVELMACPALAWLAGFRESFAQMVMGIAVAVWIAFCIAAVVFGHIGLMRRRTCGEHETHLAKAGLMLGWAPFILFGLPLALIWLLSFL